MREFTFYVSKDENFEIELWNHYGGITEELLASNIFSTVDKILTYIEESLNHYNYDKEFYLCFEGKKYLCPKAIGAIL